MDHDNPFKPPLADVAGSADAPVDDPSSGAPRVALGIFAALQVLWLVADGPRVLALVEVGALKAIWLFAGVAGLVCLYVGLLRVLRRRRCGDGVFLAALALLLLTMAGWHDAPSLFMLFGLSVGLAAGAWLLARADARRAAQPGAPA